MGDLLLVTSTFDLLLAALVKIADAVTRSSDSTVKRFTTGLVRVKDYEAHLRTLRLRLRTSESRLRRQRRESSDDATKDDSRANAQESLHSRLQKLQEQALLAYSTLYDVKDICDGDRALLKHFISAWGSAPSEFYRPDLLVKILAKDRLDMLAECLDALANIVSDLDMCADMRRFHEMRMSTGITPIKIKAAARRPVCERRVECVRRIGIVDSLSQAVDEFFAELLVRPSEWQFQIILDWDSPHNLRSLWASPADSFRFCNPLQARHAAASKDFLPEIYLFDSDSRHNILMDSVPSLRARGESHNERTCYRVKGIYHDLVHVSGPAERRETVRRKTNLLRCRFALFFAIYQVVLWSNPHSTLSYGAGTRESAPETHEMAALFDCNIGKECMARRKPFRSDPFLSWARLLAELALAQSLEPLESSGDILFYVEGQHSSQEPIGRGCLLSKIQGATSVLYQRAVSYCFFEEELEAKRNPLAYETLSGCSSLPASGEQIGRFFECVIKPLDEHHGLLPRQPAKS